MTNAAPTGEPPDAPAADEAERQLLAAQVEIVMAAQPLDLAVQMLAGAVTASEEALAALPADASPPEIREAWASSIQALRFFARPLVRRAASMTTLANQLRAAAGLRFHWND